MTQTYRDLPTEELPPPRRPQIASRRLILITAAVAVVAVVAVWIVAFSSVLGVRTVKVLGLHTLTVQQVTSAADIAHGTPLLRLDTAAVQRRVAALPEVASAKVSTSYPSTVTITVTERVAVGVVKQGNGYVLVDATGDQFRTVSARPSGLPLFVVPSGSAGRATGEAVASVASALDSALRAKIASIQALDPQAITLLLSDGTVVAWGSAQQSALKASLLPVLLKRSGQHQINVTNPAAPYTR